MSKKEAQARKRVNKLFEQAGWHFFPEDGRPDIAAQRETIFRYEQKIESAIARIWGKSLVAEPLLKTPASI